jgi:hypothetical protein
MTRNRGRMLGPMLIAACAALGVAGCGTVHAPENGTVRAPEKVCAAPGAAGCEPGTPSARAVPTPTQSPKQRADVQSASGQLPSAASVVTFSLGLGLNADGKQPPAPATVTDPAKVSRIVALIDAQPLFPPGPYSCPADDGQFLKLTFRAKTGGPVLAVATLATSGCEGILITVGGKQQPELGPAVGRPTATQVLKIAGLRWQLPQWP